MKRSRIVLIGALTAGAGLLAWAYFSTRTVWRTASEAEVLAVLDPKLTQVEPRDLAAEARFMRLRGHLERIRVGESVDRTLPGRLYRLRDSREVADLRELLAEGPMRQAPDGEHYGRFAGFYGVRHLAAALAECGERDLKARHLPQARSWFVAAARLTEQIGDASDHHYNVVFQLSAEERLGEALGPNLRRFEERDLAALAESMPPLSRDDASFRRAFRTALRPMLLPAIADPYQFMKLYPPLGSPEKRIAQIAGWVDLEPDGRYSVTFDAIETAREANRIFLPVIANTSRSPLDWDKSGKGYARTLLRACYAPSSHGPRALSMRVQNATTCKAARISGSLS